MTHNRIPKSISPTQRKEPRRHVFTAPYFDVDRDLETLGLYLRTEGDAFRLDTCHVFFLVPNEPRLIHREEVMTPKTFFLEHGYVLDNKIAEFIKTCQYSAAAPHADGVTRFRDWRDSVLQSLRAGPDPPIFNYVESLHQL
ncbi:MAG: hypothetical protein Q9227_008385 [Pyrenula ochraceoflavens]